MRSKKVARNYIIFAIISHAKDGGDPLVFVGKTTQRNTDAVFRQFRRNPGHAEPIFEEGINPQIHILKSIHATIREANQYVLSYMRYFEEAEWDLRSHDTLFEACLDLHAEAQKLYDQIADVPISEILSPKNEQLVSTPPPSKPPQPKLQLTSRLSIRITKDEHNAFTDFCQTNNLTQRDALLSLFSTNNPLESSTAQRIHDQAQLIALQRNHIKRLNNTIKNGSRGANADKRLIDALTLCQAAVYEYFRTILNDYDLPKPLPCPSWNRFKKDGPDVGDYVFPRQTKLIFQLEYLCYSKSQTNCVFIFGRDYAGPKIRLRLFDKREFTGPFPNRSPYWYAGARFLVYCKEDTHGAVDLQVCLPLPPDTQASNFKSNTFTDSLDYILKSATARSSEPSV